MAEAFHVEHVVFADSISGCMAGVVFTLLLLAACKSDLQTRRIPNQLVVALLLLGLAYSTSVLGLLIGLRHAAIGVVVGLVFWLPFWMLGWLGAGDVKLFAAAAAWLGAWGAVHAAGVAALVGGILSVVWLGWHRGIRVAMEKSLIAIIHPRVLASPSALVGDRRRLVPYGLALAIGLLVVAWFPSLLPF